MIMLTNTQRNDFVANILAYNFNTSQLKFIIYLYNTTINVQKASLYIPNISRLAKDLCIDRSNFYRDIKLLCDYDVIINTKNNFSINLDYKTWQTEQNELNKIRKRMGIDINKQLLDKKCCK